MHFSNETFTELMKIRENRRCFDCNVKSCQWASVNNGIFLCTNCSGAHRGYGVDKSYIRSILWDNWTENQLEFMKKGGNKNLKEFLLDYPYDMNQITPERFYNSKIICYYRKLLKSKVDNNNLDILPPSKEEAFEENNKVNINKNNFSSYGSVGQNVSDDKDNNLNNNVFNNSIQNGFNNVYDFMGKAVENTKNAFSGLELGNKINNAKNAIKDVGKNIMESKQINSIINFFWKTKNEDEVENQETKDNNNNNIDNRNEKIDNNVFEENKYNQNNENI